MGKINGRMREELKILFLTICDGLRYELRQRRLARLVNGRNFSIIEEREIGLASILALHLRLVGFAVQLDAYFYGNSQRRPDFGIWLPASGEYIYLELKQTAWGDYSKQYYYADAIEDIKKLNGEDDSGNQRNGLIAIGFSDPKKRKELLSEGFSKYLSERIARDFPQYEEIGLDSVDFEGFDDKSSYAMIGLWFRRVWKDS